MTDMRISYDKTSKASNFMHKLRQVLKFLSINAAVLCPFINYFLKGKMWSVVVLWSIFVFWKLFLAPDVLEFTSIGTVFRIGSYAIIELILVDLFLSPGWIGFVLPIVGFGILILSAILFLIRLDTHRNNIMPLIWETIIALAAFIAVYYIKDELNWPMITLGAVAAVFALVGLVAFHRDIRAELKKRFHTK